MFAWVGIDMVLWGFITRYLNSVSSPGFNFVPVFLGAVLLWDFFTRVMQGVTMVFFEDVWSRNFLNIFATPLSVMEYLSGLVLTSLATSFVGLLVMWVLASAVFGLSYAVYGLRIVLYLSILLMFGISLGILACAMVLRLGPAAEWFVWPIPALLAPFAGVFYPLSTLPRWMRGIGRMLPPSYVFEGMRPIVLGKGAGGILPVWGAFLGVCYIFLACWVFTIVFKSAVRSGLLARYSAESVS